MGEAFITRRGGGGASLNFKIVGGTTQPTSPAENTIWVNTNTAITDWVFAADEPASPVAGMVWIKTGTSSAGAFNAVKKNGIWVYPTSCSQYVSGAWVYKATNIYQGGAWKDFAIWLFNNGNIYSAITGGWGHTKYNPDFGREADVTITDVIKISSNGSTSECSFAHTNNKIDITPYKDIYCLVSVTRAFRQMNISVNSTVLNEGTVSTAGFTGSGLVALDVSEISGSYYIGVKASNDYGNRRSAEIEIQEVYLI